MINWLKNLFKERIWKETKRTFLRRERERATIGVDIFDFYSVEYEDILSGDKRTKEVKEYKGFIL